jgi:hypothetical protein
MIMFCKDTGIILMPFRLRVHAFLLRSPFSPQGSICRTNLAINRQIIFPDRNPGRRVGNKVLSREGIVVGKNRDFSREYLLFPGIIFQQLKFNKAPRIPLSILNPGSFGQGDSNQTYDRFLPFLTSWIIVL